MKRLRGRSCVGVLVFAIGCARASPSTTVQTEAPAVMPVEREPDASTVGVARPTPEQILGLTLDDARVQHFVEGMRFEESRYEDRIYEVSNDHGIDLLIEGGVISTIFLHALGHEDHQQYAGPMPGGIQFGDQRERVGELLGNPSVRRLEGLSIDPQYGSDGGLEMVTLTHLAADPDQQ